MIPSSSRATRVIWTFTALVIVFLTCCFNPAADVDQTARLLVLDQGTAIKNGDTIVFGIVEVGLSATRAFAIGNAGTADLFLTGDPVIALEGGKL